MNIRGKRILLRAIESADLPILHDWLNDPEIAAGLGGIHFPSSLYQQEKWLERIQTDQETIRLAACRDESHQFGERLRGALVAFFTDRHAVKAADRVFDRNGSGGPCSAGGFRHCDDFQPDPIRIADPNGALA